MAEQQTDESLPKTYSSFREYLGALLEEIEEGYRDAAAFEKEVGREYTPLSIGLQGKQGSFSEMVRIAGGYKTPTR